MCRMIKSTIALLFLLQVVCWSAETEVQVLKGKVRAKTPDQQVDISVGQKGILAEGQKPLVMVNDPIVQQVIEMYRWAQEEKKAGLNPIESINVAVQSLDEENVWQYSALLEWTNQSTEKLDVITVGPMTTMDNLQIYDTQGRVLAYEAKSEGTNTSRYTIHFLDSIEPNQKMSYIVTSKNYNRVHWQSKGPVWNINFGWGTGLVYRLQYTKIILPKSAILLSSFPAYIVTDKVEDRIALTFRHYGKSQLLSLQQVSFLWPDKDGTTLQDVPARVRGLIDPNEIQMGQALRNGLDSILAGQRVADTTTPINSLLTLVSFLAHDLDKLDILWDSAPFLKTMFGNDMAKAKTDLAINKDYIYIADYYGGGIIPKDAKEGTVVPIILKLKGTVAPYAKIEFVNHGGQWMPISMTQL
jgi:hypothetical protein